MLPIFTTEQIKEGIDTGELMIDLSEYMKKKDGVSKSELDSLTSVVANKLDATPQHKHDISDVKDLREELDSKYDTSKKYSYNVLLSDSEKIPYLESPKVLSMEIANKFDVEGYVFYVDDISGDLMITLNDVLIGSYSKAAGKWSWESDNSAINSVDVKINEYIAKTDAVLKNHYDALLLLCEKHGMVDGDGDAGNNITPT